MLSKKSITVIISVAVGLAVALLAVLLVMKYAKDAFKDGTSSYLSADSSDSSYASSSEPAQAVSAPVDNGIRLSITSPESKNIKTTEATYTFSGTSDPAEPLTMNGETVERGENGIFSLTVNLNIGNNTFTFSHKGENHTYTVNYRYVVIESYRPSGSKEYSCGATFAVSVKARKGSTVTAAFMGNTVSLVPQAEQDETEQSDIFINYGGSFKLPDNNYSDVNHGKITYTAIYDGKSETFYSGDIICLKPDFIVESDPNFKSGGRYIDVGSGKITEIIAYEAETFNAFATDDASRPTNNYLPQGTMDYSSQSYVYYENSTEKKEYAVLRCGYQVYTSHKDKPTSNTVQIVKEYAGTLPDHNEIGISSFQNSGQHTVLTLDTMWKAPFYFDLLPQGYSSPSNQDYRISSATYTYVDITFCYATVLTGEIAIPEDNPIFASAEIIQNENDYTLRLHLKKKGGFYGWSAKYNENGQLVFEFLNPVAVTAADNYYGYDLTGVKVLVDVGHGGIDPGAVSFSNTYTEAYVNLVLANQIKAELESIGATVYLTRSDNSTSSADTKIKMLQQLKPDFCIAVHHNSHYRSDVSGFEVCYSQPFAASAAKYIRDCTYETDFYSKYELDWHYYFMARCTNCPVVLTENGYMSNKYDYNNIINTEQSLRKAKAIAKGIVQYFASIQ